MVRHLSHPDRLATPQSSRSGPHPQHVLGSPVPNQLVEMTIAGRRIELSVGRLGRGLWGAAGVFADRDIAVVGRTYEDALERWQTAAFDDWLSA